MVEVAPLPEKTVGAPCPGRERRAGGRERHDLALLKPAPERLRWCREFSHYSRGSSVSPWDKGRLGQAPAGSRDRNSAGGCITGAVLDEDTSSERNGANMLFDPPTLAAPFPEKDRHVLASETCDSLMSQSLLQFKSVMVQISRPRITMEGDRDQPEILPKHSASEVGIDVASPVGSPPTLGHSLEFITDKAAQAETQPVEPDLDEKPANTGAGLDSGGPPKSDAVNLDADHDTEMGTFGW
ncbi:hypothetical protein SASPL_148569 [Salvia splendens]|uniref:Uncharacterized protein n=1 Tax=Salvia splendens TaxID=180675 RepID=A0A8X8Z4E6_SALSN|nr:hypothetical protein SASPL_148569 [Salvia splendens]